MPEIAECITIEKKLYRNTKIVNIKRSKKFNQYLNKENSVRLSILKGAVVEDRFTFGKSIIWKIKKGKNSYFLINQLGMSGSWFNKKDFVKNKKNIHLTLIGDKHTIYYHDPRMFGNFLLIETNNFNEVIKKYKWGIDPNKSTILDIQKTILNIKNKDTCIKKIFLNPKFIYGIGNYLASEILFLSKIHPITKLKNLSEAEIKILSQNIKLIIKRSIKKSGFSFANGYFLPDGSLGKYKEVALVYGKKNCPTCMNEIHNIYIDSRITYICNKCQKKKN